MDSELGLKALNAMLKGKKFRLTNEAKKFWKLESREIWFAITSIHCDLTLTLIGNNHTELRFVQISHLQKFN